MPKQGCAGPVAHALGVDINMAAGAPGGGHGRSLGVEPPMAIGIMVRLRSFALAAGVAVGFSRADKAQAVACSIVA